MHVWELLIEARFPPVDFVTYFMTNGVKWEFDIIKHYNLRAIRVDTITFKDALSHNDLNGLVLDEIHILRHINHTTKKKTNDRELNQEILFLMGSKHDQRKFIIRMVSEDFFISEQLKYMINFSRYWYRNIIMKYS